MGGHVKRSAPATFTGWRSTRPLDQFWMGGIIDKYFNDKAVRYWAIWTNPGSK